MHIQQAFNETDITVLHALIRACPLGTFVVAGTAGIEINHMPFELDLSAGAHGVLRAHLPRGNPLWQQDFTTAPEAVVVFQGPDSYITPSWYPGKQQHGQAVPTWNYAVVHAYGRPSFIHDAEWLRAHVTALTNAHEATRDVPWQVSDAPADYIEKQLTRIVGVEIPITRLLGKWKVSQNRPLADRAGVAEGLDSITTGKAAAMAELVKRHL